MGELQDFAAKLFATLKNSNELYPDGIGTTDIPDIIKGIAFPGIGAINCYPGVPGDICCETAVFISLTSEKYIKKKRGHLDFESALKKVVQHMQGVCYKKTRLAVLITDKSDEKKCDKWKDNLKEINGFAHVEIYFLDGNLIRDISI